jgi:hypothetical protein
MTLCLAWKQGNEIYFTSDSRLTDSDKNVTSDDAIKIFKVSVEIYGPVPADIPNSIEPLIHQTTFGLCFAGSYINGSILADTIEEILSNIQATPFSDISIENLSDIAFAIYKQVSTQLMQINRNRGLSEILLGGYCPITSNFKLYKFFPKQYNCGNILEFEKQQILINKQTVFLGDNIAIERANVLLSKINNDYSRFHLLREIINDPQVKTVGGNIQAGLFIPTKFKTYGIVEYSKFENEYGVLQIKDNYKFRGLSLDLDDNELRKGNLNIRKTFFNPFESERHEFFNTISKNNIFMKGKYGKK